MTAASVIIPTYNRAGFLPASIESVELAGTELEIIVVDDGSSDDTPDVCRRLTGIRYIRLPSNQGLAAARNAGILSSSAEFIAFVDDDDIRLPGSIDLQVQALRANPQAAFCYGRVLLADSKHRMPTGEIVPLRLPAGDIFWDLIEGLFLIPTSIVARRQALLECGLFDEQLRKTEDWDLWLRIAENWPVIPVTEPVAVYRKAAPDSEQLCSDSVSLLRQMLAVQRRALQSRRAATAPWRRHRARLRLVKVAYDALISQAEVALAEGDMTAVRIKSREARRLRPIRSRVDLHLWRLLRAA